MNVCLCGVFLCFVCETSLPSSEGGIHSVIQNTHTHTRVHTERIENPKPFNAPLLVYQRDREERYRI